MCLLMSELGRGIVVDVYRFDNRVAGRAGKFTRVKSRNQPFPILTPSN